MVKLKEPRHQFGLHTKTKHVIAGFLTAIFAVAILTVSIVYHIYGKSSFAAVGDCNQNATNISEAVCMQDMNEAVLVSMETNAQYQLKDSRDDKIYWVARLQDGRVWMTQNLDLNLSAARTLTSNDTDLNDGSLSGAYEDGYSVDGDGVISWTPLNSTFVGYLGTGGLDAVPLKNNNYLPYSYDAGNLTKAKDGYCYDESEVASGCRIYFGLENAGWDYYKGYHWNNPDPVYDSSAHSHIGNYYNWPAAVASNDTRTIFGDDHNSIENNPQNSICPAGWRLPTVSSDANVIVLSTNEFGRLNHLYNNDAVRIDDGLSSSPVFFLNAGHIHDYGMPSFAMDAQYWSSTPESNTAARGFTAYSGEMNIAPGRPIVYVSVGVISGREEQNSVRCVSRSYAIERTLTFDNNGGSGAPSPQICASSGESCSITIPDTTMTREESEFVGWLDSETGALYQAGDSITLTGDKTLQASWRSLYTLTLFDTITGEIYEQWTCMPRETDVPNGTCTLLITDAIPTREHYLFYGWAESSGSTTLAYNPGDNITLSSSKTLYAIWISEYVLSYDLKYGSITGMLDSCYPDIPGGTCEVWIVDEDPPRDGYDFLGWDMRSSAKNVVYYPDDTVTLSSSLTIYAVWKRQSHDPGDLDGCNGQATTIDDAICLQDMNNLVKASMQLNVEYELVDARDNIVYRIARLADNNVWLLDNLQLGGDEPMLLTSADTNTNPDIDDGEFVLPASGDWVDSYTDPAIDTTDAENMLGNDADKVQGGYYNYCAASAGTYCDEADEAFENAEYDICPANWRMPTGGNDGEYQNVVNLYDDIINTLHLPLSGRFYGGSSGSIDQNGYFWSSTNRDGMRMYYLTRANQNVTTGSYRRDRGYSMRCVAKDVAQEISCNASAKNINEAVCLQDVNAMVKDSMAEDETYTLFDSRDSKPYRVAKLADDNVWMLDNLRLGNSEPILLTSEDTNTDPDINNGDFVLPASGDWIDSYTEPAIDTAGAENLLGRDADKLQGGYYNYCAASAGTYCDEADEAFANAEFDICPKGWRMPTGGDGSEQQDIIGLYGDIVGTLHLPLSGRFYGGASGSIDQNGYFWSSTNRDGMRMYYLTRANQDVTVGSYRRDRGYSMRCIMGEIEEEGSADYWWKDDVNEHALGNGDDLTLVVQLSRRALTAVMVDGENLLSSSYGLAGDGETHIVLSMNYLNTLAAGGHVLAATYLSGQTIKSEFTINEPAPAVPDTGVFGLFSGANHRSGRLIVSIVLGIITSLVAGRIMLKKKKID